MSEDYVIREVRPDEIDVVMDFLEEHHANDEVIGRAFAKKHGQPKVIPVANFASCFVAVTQGGEIVGTVMLLPAEDDLNTTDLPSGPLGEFVKAMVKVFLDSGLYEGRDPAKMLTIRRLCVHQGHRGRGLAKRLVKASVDWAKKHDNKYEMVFDFFTSTASIKAAESVGFQKMLDYDLQELRDSKGEQIIGDCTPNHIITLMTLIIKK